MEEEEEDLGKGNEKGFEFEIESERYAARFSQFRERFVSFDCVCMRINGIVIQGPKINHQI